ncbi:MAG: GntR family transcriptional regulator [Fibrobacter sp.]|nr:GntR family transcriptional regulator [Fibrobacter sp.]
MLIDDIQKSIENAGFKAGEKMPSVRKMAERLGLSVATVHRAYKSLSEAGVIQLVQGKGCFWGRAPEVTVTPEESVYSYIEKKFLADLEAGYLNAFEALPSSKELSFRYKASPYIFKKFLTQKVSQGILVRSGHKYYFSEERTVNESNYILFIHRSDNQGRMKIESERESDVFRVLTQIAAEQKISVHFIGFHEQSDKLCRHGGEEFVVKNDEHCLGIFLSTWLVKDALKLFNHFASFEGPISVWWEYDPGEVPLRVKNKKKWAFYNVAFGKESGVIVGQFLLQRGMKKVHFLSPYHASFWSNARLLGLRESGVDVLPLVNSQFASPFDLMALADKNGVDRQKFMDGIMAELMESSCLDCFVCSNDWVATSLIDYYTARGLSVPYVVGFDDTIESYRYVFDSFAFNVGTMVKEALYHIVAPTLYAEQRRQMQAPLGRVVEKR